MRKLNLENHVFNMPDQKGVLQFITYDFHKSLEGILPHQNLGLNGPELLRAMEVVEKVQKSKDAVLLTENDHKLIIETCKKFRGFTKDDHKFLKRIFNCPSVPDGSKIIKISDKFSNNGKERKGGK